MMIDENNFFIKKIEKFPPLIIFSLMVFILFLPISFGLETTILIVLFSLFLIICLKKYSLFQIIY